jgi:sec-independent protein translocase protein TatB
MREFRRQTDEVRGVVEREFYKMDQDIQEPQIRPAQDTLAQGAQPQDPHAQLHPGPTPTPADPDSLPPPTEQMSSQLTAGAPAAEPIPEKKADPAPPDPSPDPSSAAPKS